MADDDDASFLLKRITDFTNLFSTDFNRPQGCSMSILGAIDPILAECNASPRGPIVKSHKLWNTITKFIYLPRPERDFAALKLRLGYCMCARTDKSVSKSCALLHVAGKVLDDRNQGAKGDFTVLLRNDERVPVYVQAVTHMFYALNLVINSVDVSRTLKGDSEHHWPSSLDDLMPFGPDAAVKALGMWVTELGSTVPIHTLGRTLELCRARLFPSLRIPSRTPSDVVDLLYGLCARLLDYRYSQQQWKEHCEALRARTHHIYPFLHVGTNRCPHDLALFVEGSEARFAQFFSLLLYTWTCPQFHFIDEGSKLMVLDWAELGSFFVSRIKTSDLPTLGRLHPWLLYDAERDEPRRFPMPPMDRPNLMGMVYTFVTIRETKGLRLCDAPGCAKSFELAGRSFRKCTCQVTHYCSTDCQRISWEYPDAPHRDVCAPLSRFKRDMESFQSDGTLDISEEDLKKMIKHLYSSSYQSCAGSTALAAPESIDIDGQRQYADYEEYLDKVPGLDAREDPGDIREYVAAFHEKYEKRYDEEHRL